MLECFFSCIYFLGHERSTVAPMAKLNSHRNCFFISYFELAFLCCEPAAV